MPEVTADVLAHPIRDGRLAGFSGRVAAWRDDFYRGIEGRQNDARIAANFGMLAAALGEFGADLGPAWPGCREDFSAFLDEDMIPMRDARLRRVEGQQASAIFLAELRALIGPGAGRLVDGPGGLGGDREGDRTPIGRAFGREGYVAPAMEGPWGPSRGR